MSSEEFDGRPFVAGSVTAIRAFKVDSLGRLCSPTRSFVFTPGVNEATCEYNPMREMQRALSRAFTSILEVAPKTVAGPGEEDDPKHRAGQIGCSCGFYGYHCPETNPYMAGVDTVEAIVEATGLVTHGTKGIRAEKLRIVGVIDPAKRSTGSPFERASRWMAETNTDHIFGPGAIVVGIISGFGSAIAATNVSAWYLFGLLLTALCIPVLYAALRAVDCYPVMRQSVPRNRLALVRRNYPDVEFYNSRDAALKAHPLTEPPKPVVPSPDDADFWTRDAS